MTVTARCAGGRVRALRDEHTNQPGFQCSTCGDTIYRIRCWKDPENRHWAEMLEHWLNEHDPNHQMGRP